MQAEDILHFWFEELSPAQHFAQSDALDAQIRTRFGATWQAAHSAGMHWNEYLAAHADRTAGWTAHIAAASRQLCSSPWASPAGT